MVGSSAQENSLSAWEDGAASPRPYLEGVIPDIPPSPLAFSDYFQDTLSTSLPQVPNEFMMLEPSSSFSHMETTENAGSQPTDLLTTRQHLGTLPLRLNQPSSVSAPAAIGASKNPQQSKQLSRHQIYRLNVKGKAKFKDLSLQSRNEHIKMLNAALIRMTAELKTKDEQLSHLLLENDMLRKQLTPSAS